MGSGIVDPYQRFLYRVEIDGVTVAGFNKVSGIKVEVEAVSYSEGTFGGHPIQLPGIMSPGELTLERGLTDNVELWNWVLEVVETENARPKIGALSFRKDLELVLLNREAVEVKRWHVDEAWPKTYELDDLDSSTSDVLMERLVLAHEGLYLVT